MEGASGAPTLHQNQNRGRAGLQRGSSATLQQEGLTTFTTNCNKSSTTVLSSGPGWCRGSFQTQIRLFNCHRLYKEDEAPERF